MAYLKRKCSNMTQANRFVSNIIKSFDEGCSIEDKLIKDLVKYHPTKQIDANNVEWFKMKIRKPFNNLSLFYKYKNNKKEDDISWKLCIRNLYGKYSRDYEYIKDVNAAFRNESHMGTKKQYFIDNTNIINDIFMGKCKNCNIKTKNITTDHYPLPFKKIFNFFITNNKINLYNVDIFENEKNEIRLKDKKLASKWLKYHDNVAKYRLLCKSCNSHFGSYGF